MEERLENNLLEQHLMDKRWREVFLLVAGLSSNRAINLLISIHKKAQASVKGYVQLCNLIHWTKTSTEDSQENFNPVAKQALALGIFLCGDIHRAFTETSINVSRDGMRYSFGFSDSNIASAIARAIDSDIGDTAAGTINSNISNARAIATARAKNSNGDSDSTSIRTVGKVIRDVSEGLSNQFVDELIKNDISSISASAFVDMFNNSKSVDLTSKLTQLSETMPDTEDPFEVWQDWADKLDTLWFNTLGLDKVAFIFSKEEVEALHEYLYATELLIRCKDAAVRIPKQAWADLEARLLTVPPESEDILQNEAH
ncbi:MAG: hypothetical protein AAGD09_21235 [Cyanobacteria bacterium P01_F01_bin.56]